MINLLPKQEKKELHREYIFRFLIVWGIAIIIVVAISAILLFPSYFLSDLKEDFVEEQTNLYQQSERDEEREKIIVQLGEAREKLRALSAGGESVELRLVFDNIIDYSKGGIKISSLLYKRGDASKSQLTISGVADTRDNLLLFSQLIENDEFFSSVVLPISNLAKDRDIDFKIEIEGIF